MYKAKNNLVKLINKYTKEEVYTRDYDDVIKEGPNEFVRVFTQSNPQRTYLVNRAAFEIGK
tara:strand:- start:196 stop:378 length:183 start_codon:yes stop_codon:yes gene_type:complete